LHAEHARKCLKVEYLGKIEFDFQKSRVTGPWDHKVSVSAKKVKTKFHACLPLKMQWSFLMFFLQSCKYEAVFVEIKACTHSGPCNLVTHNGIQNLSDPKKFLQLSLKSLKKRKSGTWKKIFLY
jgi:hypothetical protein